MECTIKINMNNAAFSQDGQIYHYELMQILKKLTAKIQREADYNFSIDVIPLHDSNGNYVGQLEITG
jgi:hypothetical protein